jgi:hypothetical protein
MEPSSGTYGAVTELEKLSTDLQPPPPPGATGGPGPQPQAPAPGMPMGPRPTPTPGTVPDVLLGPTQRPDVPASTPLAPGSPAPGAVNAAQRNLAILDLLSRSEEVSDETREWAQLVLTTLAGAQA